jgi:alpha-tubulin suppressor-like RCC1 family protein
MISLSRALALAMLCACFEGGGSGAAAPVKEGLPPEDALTPGTPTDIDCGDFTTCALASDGFARCWGNDKEGELGDGQRGDRMKRGVVPGIGKVRKVALASQFGCALLDDQKVKCWGTGRIANDGKVWNDAKPLFVAGVEQAEELVASGAIACARTPGGITCWGADAQTIGAPPAGTFKQIAAGFTHACALDPAGAVTCWGATEWAPFAKPSVSGATQVVTGDRHACVVTKSKAVQCWGMNDAGQLGTKPDMTQHKKPQTVPGVVNVVHLEAGEASTCALLADGSVRCWGANGEGELGLGKRSSDERPARVPALANVERLCLASAHGCALTRQSQLFCWGANAYGQLGDGTKERRSAPTPVAW